MTDKHVYKRIPVEDIQDPHLRSRFDPDDPGIQSLASSIHEVGLLEPIVVVRGRDSGFALVAGQRRLRAARMLGWEEIPAHVLEGDYTYQGAATIAENLHREDLKPLEEAVTVAEYIELHDLSNAEAARRLGVSRTWVQHRLRLLQLPEDLQDAVHLGHISPSIAFELGRIEDKNQREYYAKIIVQNGATLDVVRDWVRNYLEYQNPEQSEPVEPPTYDGEITSAEPEPPSCFVCEGKPPRKPLRMMYVCWECAAALEGATKEKA